MLQLNTQSAHAVRVSLVNTFHPDNEEMKSNPFVPSLNALRLLKHKENKIETDSMDTLLEWKDTKYQKVILAVAHSPFYLIYRTVLQESWYVAQSKRNAMRISIDATGRIVKPPLLTLLRQAIAKNCWIRLIETCFSICYNGQNR